MLSELTLPLKHHSQTFELALPASATVADLRELVCEVLGTEYILTKLVLKTRILKDGEPLGALRIEPGGHIFVVENKAKPLPAQQDVRLIPTLQSGQSSFSPVGHSNYEIRHMPQYHSAISQMADPEALEEMMKDPQNKRMLEDLLSDPQTLQRMIQQDPLLSRLVKERPEMRILLDNPQLLASLYKNIDIKALTQAATTGAPLSAPAFAPQALPQQMVQQQRAMARLMGMGAGFGETGEQRIARLSLKYEKQLKYLQEQLGLKDRQANVQALEECNGDVFAALDKLAQ